MGLYAWVFALAFGTVLLDGVYANSLMNSAGLDVITNAFNEAADFLQLPLALAVIAGIAALVVTAHRSAARNCVIASLVLILSPLPVILIFGETITEAGAGGILRLALGAGSSLLAMAATVSFFRRTRDT
jgi:hypothetical protein